MAELENLTLVDSKHKAAERLLQDIKRYHARLPPTWTPTWLPRLAVPMLTALLFPLLLFPVQDPSETRAVRQQGPLA